MKNSSKKTEFEFELLLAKVIIAQDADALRSLIESEASANERFVKTAGRNYPKIAGILAPEEQEWLRLQLGGEDYRSGNFNKVRCTKLVSILELAAVVEFPYLEFRDFLLKSSYSVYAMKKGDRTIAEGIPFTVVAIACLDYVSFSVANRMPGVNLCLQT